MANYRPLKGMVWGVILLLFSPLTTIAQNNQCDKPLGLQDGTIPDASITSSEDGSNPGWARLDGSGAWCVKVSPKFSLKPLTLTVDLGQTRLISGLVTQGPPASMYHPSYHYSILFFVQNSTQDTPDEWGWCCGHSRAEYTASDIHTEADEKTRHNLTGLVLARHVRLNFRTDIKSIGNENKCLRLEILGCPTDVEPVTGVEIKAEPSGFISVAWSSGAVLVPTKTDDNGVSGTTSITLSATEYKVRLMRTGGGEADKEEKASVQAKSYIISLPLWGATYTVWLVCVHQGLELKCGTASVQAVLNVCTATNCPETDPVTFRGPREIKAEVVGEGKVELIFEVDQSGWITAESDLQLVDAQESQITKETLTSKDREAEVSGVEEGKKYTLKLSPKDSAGILDTVSHDLHIIAWKDVKLSPLTSGYGAFVADVQLAADVLWNGMLNVTWMPAKVLGPPQDNQTTPSSYAACMYTVQVLFNQENWTANVSLSEEESAKDDLLAVTMSQLSFKTEYKVLLSCYFEEVAIQCGEVSAYTAMPLKFSKVKDGKIIVHTVTKKRAGWKQQLKHCQRSNGTLTSLSTKDKSELLDSMLVKGASIKPNPALHWIGLNLCPNYTGSVWSDHSVWDFSRMPAHGNQLTTATCCIQNSWDGKQFVWLGEVCDALLPAVCEYHPEGLVGEIKDLKRANATETQAGVTWTYVEDYWTPTSLNASYCTFRPLKYILTDEGNASSTCKVIQIDVEEDSHEEDDLEPFTEYQVSVAASIQPGGYSGNPAVTYVRTIPEKPLLAEMLSSGHISVMWAQKVSEFGENDIVQLTLVDNAIKDKPLESDRNIKASGIKLGGLKMGANYTLTLKEKDGKKRTETASFVAFPPCDCEDCQVGGLCFHATKQPVTLGKAAVSCLAEEASLAVIRTPNEVALLLKKATALGDDLWVSHLSSKVKAPAATSALQGGSGSQVLDSTTTTTAVPTTAPLPSECLMVSRAAKAVMVEQCTNAHRAACAYKAPVEGVFANLEAVAGPKSVKFSWNEDKFGFDCNMSLNYQPKSENRYKRESFYMPIQKSPVTVENLKKDTPYSFVLDAEVAKGFLSITKRVTVTTTNASDPSTSARLTVAGWSPLAADNILQLVCNSLLVAACIATMLLFFATGMFYQDCIAQLGFLACLLTAYFLLLLAHPGFVDEDSETRCIVVAVMLHLFFLGAFMFLMLEALTIAHLLVISVKSPLQSSNWLLVVIGVLIPLVIVGVSAGALYYSYPDYAAHNCWLNPEGSAIWAAVIPIGILAIACIVLLLLTTCSTPPLPETIAINLRGRQSDTRKLRWVVLALVIELCFAWGSGVAAYQLHHPSTYALFCASTLLLTITIVGARTTFDDTFRSKMHRLCCGTDLTYKRSEILSISARSRISPKNTSASSARLITPVGNKIDAAHRSGYRRGRVTPSSAASRSTSAMSRITSAGCGRDSPSVGTTIFTVQSTTPPICRPSPPKLSPKADVYTVHESEETASTIEGLSKTYRSPSRHNYRGTESSSSRRSSTSSSKRLISTESSITLPSRPQSSRSSLSTHSIIPEGSDEGLLPLKLPGVSQ